VNQTMRERWRLIAVTLAVLAMLLLLVVPWCTPWPIAQKLGWDACVLLVVASGCLITAAAP
jgi:uncharacterized membrane protein